MKLKRKKSSGDEIQFSSLPLTDGRKCFLSRSLSVPSGLSAPKKRAFFRKPLALAGYRAGLPSSLGSIVPALAAPKPQVPSQAKETGGKILCKVSL